MKHRGVVMSTKGMVASAHTLISSSGLKVLQNGGNAMDASIAMALTSGLVLPDMCGLGGDAFLLYYDAETKKITAINGSGGAPQKATIEAYNALGHQKVPNSGMLSVTVPGAVDVYYTALEKFGSMSFSDLCKDAIELARNGVPLSEKVVRHMHTDYHKMMQYDALSKMYLNNNQPYHVGDVIKNEDYAKTLEYLCKTGKDGFYKGNIADKIVAHSKKHGGLFEKSDFENYHCDILEAISIPYRDYILYQTPPVSQGIIHLEEMAILNHFDLGSMERLSSDVIHLMVEAKKIAFYDRIRYFGDPSYITNPTITLLSEDYTKKMADKINLSHCLDEKEIFDFEDGHTTSFVAVDKWGNAVSFIHSIAATWGSCEIVEGTGMLLNNRCTGFTLDKNHPNALMPTKKTMHTLNTFIITDKEGTLRFVGNTPGGDNQPQWNMQVVSNIIDYKLDVQSALEHPKWTDIHEFLEDGSVKHTLKIESQIGEQVLEELRKKGHHLQVIEPYTCSGASQLIEIREDGLRLGGSDPRGDGAAMPEI